MVVREGSIRRCTCAALTAVINAQVKPTVTPSNTNAATIVIGDKGADLVKGARR